MLSRGSKISGPASWMPILAAFCTLIPTALVAQTPSEHDEHHPAGAASPETVAPSSLSDPQAEAESESMGMSTSRRMEFYPELMRLRELTPESRREAEDMARERMRTGLELMSSSFARLEQAKALEDLPRMSDALSQARQGIEQLQSGTAALQALAAGKTPQEISLEWFRNSMNLPSADVTRPHGLFGLSAFHYFSMFLLAAVAVTMIWTSWQRTRRSRALVARLVDERGGAPLDAEPPKPQAIPTSAAGERPSRANSWTGLLRVARIFEESPNVRTLRLVNPDGSEVPFRHLPGQFVTFTVRPIDQLVKRSYTIASSPTRRDYLEVTVKREERGTVSSFLHGVHEGDTLQVVGPSGNFTFMGEGANSIVLISGGVGVTPMMSVLRYLTDRSWSGDIFFVYACKSDRDVIYRQELEYLQLRYPNLKLVIAAEEAGAEWPHGRGRLTANLLAAVIPHIQTRRIHLCGPPAMMTALRAALTELNVPPEQVKTEVFIGRERPKPDHSGDAQAATASPTVANSEIAAAPSVAVVSFARSRQTALLPLGKTVLEASEDVGVNIDYSCRVGVCGLCKVKLLSGSVTMEVQDSLDADDKTNNVILACQAKSTGDLAVDA
jgi:ferredoxin-NADP reductase